MHARHVLGSTAPGISNAILAASWQRIRNPPNLDQVACTEHAETKSATRKQA